MKIQPLFEMQRNYNSSLVINDELSLYKLHARKNLEFQIQLGDLANETKCFNYLKTESQPIDINIISAKYISCISKLLSLGIDNNYTDLTDVPLTPNDYCLSDQFLNLYFDLNDLIMSPSKDHYLTLFQDFLSLGLTMGFSEEKIIKNFEISIKK